MQLEHDENQVNHDLNIRASINEDRRKDYLEQQKNNLNISGSLNSSFVNLRKLSTVFCLSILYKVFVGYQLSLEYKCMAMSQN